MLCGSGAASFADSRGLETSSASSYQVTEESLAAWRKYTCMVQQAQAEQQQQRQQLGVQEQSQSNALCLQAGSAANILEQAETLDTVGVVAVDPYGRCVEECMQ